MNVSIPRRTIVTLLLLLGSLPVSPGAQTAPDQGPPQIRTIDIVTHDVFDQPTAGWSAPYRAANRFHITTRESVIRRELLFASGDALDPIRVEQTERNLRALPFLRDARIESLAVDDDEPDGRPPGAAERVDIRVEVWDIWSLIPQVQFAHIADETVWSAGVSETNLLGWGQRGIGLA